MMNWTKEDFEAYVMLYAAHCNYIETKEESDYILSKIDERIFNGIHTEIVMDTEEQKLEKIKEYLEENKYSIEDRRALLRDIKNVFFADGTVDALERKVFSFLQKVLS